MKIRYLSLIVLLVMSVFAPMQAQTYDNLWKELEVLERKDLPKSVISEAMKIYDKAKAEQNVPQMMKAYLTAMQYRSLLTPDSLKVDMNGLEQWASQTGSVEDKAILYSILGEMTMPVDVKKGLGYLQASLKDKDRLLLIPVEKLRPMVRLVNGIFVIICTTCWHVVPYRSCSSTGGRRLLKQIRQTVCLWI